jgi:hypothetical protein
MLAIKVQFGHPASLWYWGVACNRIASSQVVDAWSRLLSGGPRRAVVNSEEMYQTAKRLPRERS